MIERGARRDPEPLAELAHRRRHAVLGLEAAHETQHLALPAPVSTGTEVAGVGSDAACGAMIGSGSLMCRFVSTVALNSSLALRNSRSARPIIRPSSGSFPGPKTKRASTPMTSIS